MIDAPPKQSAKERAREILETRKSRDPLAHYQPGITQRNCLMSMAMVRLLQGGNRSGKTAHMCVEISLAARKKHPTRTVEKPVTYIVFAISRSQISDLHGKMRVKSDLKGPCSEYPMIPDHEVKKEHFAPGVGKPVCREIEMKNGNRILYALSGQDASWEMIQGKGRIAGIALDEQAGTQDLIDECMARLTELNNPEQIAEFGGAWFFWSTSETMVNPAWDLMKKRAQQSEQTDAAFFQIKSEENPAVSMEARARTAQFMSDEAVAIRHRGDVGAIDSYYIFRKQWDRDRHVLAEPYEPEPGDNIWMTYDPGWDHPWALLFAILRQDNPNQIRIVQACTGRKQTLDHVANEAARWLNGRSLEAIVCDPAAKKTEHSRGEMLSVQFENLLRQMKVESHRGMIFGRNRYEDTLPNMQRYLDPNPEDKTVTPWLVVDPPTATNGTALVIEQIASYRQNDKSNGERKGHNIWKHNDEFVDTPRYLCSRMPAWCQRPPNLPRSYQLSKGMPITYKPDRPDPLAIRTDMSEAERQHILRLRESGRVIGRRLAGGGPRQMPSAPMRW